MKKNILNQLKKSVSNEIEKLNVANLSTKELATGGDSKAESKWDTRGLEASYLSGAFEKRLNELNQELQILNDVDLSLTTNSKTVTIGSLVKLEYNKNIQTYFLSPTAGGTTLKIDDMIVMVISIFSPIGTHIMELSAGDEFEIELDHGRKNRTYKIIEVV